MSKVYISDTNIWIDFAHANLLAEIFKLPFDFCCTDFVLGEINDIETHQSLLKLGLIVEKIDERNIAHLYSLMESHNNSSLADVSCFFLAKQTRIPLLTGDQKLRKQAAADGLTVYGSLWLLDLLVAHKIINKVRAAQCLELMLENGARFPQSECQSRIAGWRSVCQ